MRKLTIIAIFPTLFGVIVALSACDFHVLNTQACVDWEPGVCRERSDDMALSDFNAEAFATECEDRGGELRELPGLCDSNRDDGPTESVGHCEYTQVEVVEVFTDSYSDAWTQTEAQADCTGTWVQAGAEA